MSRARDSRVPPDKSKTTLNLNKKIKRAAQIAALERGVALGVLVDQALTLLLGLKESKLK